MRAVLSVLVALWQVLAPSLSQGEFAALVVSIKDSDTIEVLHDGKAERIRPHSIDCPEKGQAHGNKAK
jgi:micrococcal nuclease